MTAKTLARDCVNNPRANNGRREIVYQSGASLRPARRSRARVVHRCLMPGRRAQRYHCFLLYNSRKKLKKTKKKTETVLSTAEPPKLFQVIAKSGVLSSAARARPTRTVRSRGLRPTLSSAARLRPFRCVSDGLIVSHSNRTLGVTEIGHTFAFLNTQSEPRATSRLLRGWRDSCIASPDPKVNKTRTLRNTPIGL